MKTSAVAPSVITTKRVAMASIVIAAVVMAIKYLAYWKTGSVALLSDALESIVNVMTAIAALIAIRLSERPADRHHQFGHHKAEYFSAVLEGILIVLAAAMILREAWQALAHPRTLTEPVAGLAISLVATALNAAWATFLVRRGAAMRSPALVADGWHLATDVFTSIGVLVGLILAIATGWSFLDPLLASLVAVNILVAGWKLIRTSLSSLMDQAVDPDTARSIRGVIEANLAGAIEAHDVRTRGAGRAIFIEFHLVVPAAMTVGEAHVICDRLEDAIGRQVEGAEVVIHVEPEHEAKRPAPGAGAA